MQEVNLNVGCPSDRVQNGAFGACLMREPALVGDCVKAMKDAVAIPVTVKCRIGVDDQDREQALFALAEACVAKRRRRAVRPCAKGLAQGPLAEGKQGRRRRWTMRWCIVSSARCRTFRSPSMAA